MKNGRLLRLSAIAVALLAGGPFAATQAAEAEPDAVATQKLVDAMREAALAYTSKLPDFICTQVTHREFQRDRAPSASVRTSAPHGGGPASGIVDHDWRPVDTIEQQLSYFSHQETYKLVSTNGKRAAGGEAAPSGMASTGEFGSTLAGIFDPPSHAEFTWKRWDKLRGRPVYVFSFSVAKENSTALIEAGASRIVVGYHGLLFVDRETNTFMRVTTEAEIPPDFPLQHVTHLLDYGPAMIAGERYLLPVHSEMESRAREDFVDSGLLGGTSAMVNFRNKIDFKGYRKYAAEATLKPE
jgi:hypothetical protein